MTHQEESQAKTSPAEAPSAGEPSPKHHIIGGAVIVALLVFIYTSVFEQAPPETLIKKDIVIPTQKAVVPLTPKVVVEPPADIPEETVDLTTETETLTSPTAATAATVQPDTQPDASLGAREGNFVVQVAALVDSERAEKLVLDLKDAGMPAFIEPFRHGDQTLHRVRIGRFENRAEAEQARAHAIKLGLDKPDIIDLR